MPLPFESGRKIEIMPKKIPEDTKQRVVRLVLDYLDEYPNLTVVCQTVGRDARIGDNLTCLVGGADRACLTPTKDAVPKELTSIAGVESARAQLRSG